MFKVIFIFLFFIGAIAQLHAAIVETNASPQSVLSTPQNLSLNSFLTL